MSMEHTFSSPPDDAPELSYRLTDVRMFGLAVAPGVADRDLRVATWIIFAPDGRCFAVREWRRRPREGLHQFCDRAMSEAMAGVGANMVSLVVESEAIANRRQRGDLQAQADALKAHRSGGGA